MKASYVLLLPIVVMCFSCTLRVPVQALETPVAVANYFYCRISLEGYFNEDYGLTKSGERGMVILQSTIPQQAFSKNGYPVSKKLYKPSKKSDNRVVFYLDKKTVASGIVDSIVISDNSLNDIIEFGVSKSFGGIGFVGQNRNSLVVKLADGKGTIFEGIEKMPFEQSAWYGFKNSSYSTVFLTSEKYDWYRNRTGVSEVFTVDEVKADCI